MTKDNSQHGEQETILKFFEGQLSGRFLDLGAYDGVTNSNTKALADLGWGGVCVEANPFSFIKLKATHQGNPHVACICAAVMPQADLIQFANSREPQLATCRSPETLREWFSETLLVAAITPQMIAERVGAGFDFVSLDVEGVDLEVLKAMQPVLAETKLLCIEDSPPMEVFNQAHYDELIKVAAGHGFKRLIARTNLGEGTFGNSLLAKA